MSGNGYYRFFPGDYLRDTLHLGWLEDCAYRRLIDLYQSHDTAIRNDRAYIMRALRASEPEQMAAVDTVLAEFFTLKADGWHQQRCDAEVRYRARAREHGTSAAKSRWENLNKSIELHASALPEQCQPEPEPEPEPEDIANTVPKRKRGKRAASLLTPVPTEINLSDRMLAWALAEGVDAARAARETDQFLDHHKGKGSLQADWDATWRTWIRNVVKYAKA